MRLRFLLMLMLIFGLMAGPASSWSHGAGSVQGALCPCEMVKGESCCVSENDGAPREMSAGVSTSGINLKSLLMPVRTFLGLQPEPVGFAPVSVRDCTKRPSAPALLDLNCIRLI